MNPPEDASTQHVPITAEIPLVGQPTGPLPVTHSMRGHHLGWARLEAPAEAAEAAPTAAFTIEHPTVEQEIIGRPTVEQPIIAEPAVPVSRGEHLGWAGVEEPPAPEPAPAPPALEETAPVRVMQQTPATARTILPPMPSGPGALGRLAALVVTLGIAWALGVALLVWLGTLVFSR